MGSSLQLTWQYVWIEQLSALALTVSWLVGAAIAGTLDDAWFDLARQQPSPVGVVGTLLRGWSFAVPLAAFSKAVAVAAVIMPVGGWIAADLPTAIADLGGMLVAVSMWRLALLMVM